MKAEPFVGSRRLASLVGLMAAAVALVCMSAASSFAQAWLPAKGEGSISTSVQIFHVDWHLEFDGSEQEETNTQIRNVTADATYGLTNRLALDFGIPYVASRFGDVSHPCPDAVPGYIPCAVPDNPTIDNGKYYRTFQDFRLRVRYALWSRHVTLTPSVAVGLPSHAYATIGHVAPGRDLRELDLGLHAGRFLAPFAPNTYVHASYVYAVSQHVVHHDLDLNLNRSNADVEVGHQLAPRLTVRAFASWQRTHGGLEWTDDLFEPGSAHEEIHDQAARASYWRAGAGLSYTVNDALGIDVSMLTTLAGKNSHTVAGVSLGTTWSFGRSSGVIGARSGK